MKKNRITNHNWISAKTVLIAIIMLLTVLGCVYLFLYGETLKKPYQSLNQSKESESASTNAPEAVETASVSESESNNQKQSGKNEDGLNGASTDLDANLSDCIIAINNLSDWKNGTEEIDLSVAGLNNSVFFQLKNGHILTKNFDSSVIGSLSDLSTTVQSSLVSAINELNSSKLKNYQGIENAGKNLVVGNDGQIECQDKPEETTTQSEFLAKVDHTDSGVDLFISDEDETGIISVVNGNIRTEHFSSDNGIYESKFEYANQFGTETITHSFPQGTRLAFHLTINDMRESDAIKSSKITYSYTDTSGVTHTLGSDYGYNFPEYVLDSDAVSVSAAYGSNLSWEKDVVLSFKVYSMASFPREPHVLTVAPEGKEYSSLRDAIEYAKQYADALNRYEIHVYPGTYDTLSYFTPDEIAEEGFTGLFLTNGISLIGIGQGSEIVLTASMSPEDYPPSKRNDISTLNIWGNTTVKNITIKADNIRYAVHDDSELMMHQQDIHIFEEVTFIGTNLTSHGGGNLSYGAGGGNNKRLYFKNCDFSDAMLIHTAENMQHEYTAYLENCRSRMMKFNDYNSGMNAHFYLKNCSVSQIRLNQIGGDHDQYIRLEGEGTNNVIVSCPPGYVYALDGVHKFFGVNIKPGKAVKLNDSMDSISVTSSLVKFYGISIGVVDGATYVQTDGWVNSNSLGLNNLAVEDYLMIDPDTGAIICGGSSDNAVAQVKYVDSDNVAYAKLLK